MNGFEMDMSHILDEAQTLNKTPAELKKIADAAMEAMVTNIKREAPKKTRRLEKSVKKISKVRAFSAESTVYIEAWYAKSLNDGNSKTRKHAGYFDRAVDNTTDEVFDTVQKTLGW